MQAVSVISGPTVAPTRELFERLFVLVDFTSASHRAVEVAFELKRAFGSRICLFGIAEATGGDEFLGGLGAPASPGDLVDAELGRLRRFIGNIVPDGEVEVRARGGTKPVDEVHDEALRWNATLLVAAATFEGFFRSRAEKLVHGCKIPVLLLPAVEVQSAPRITAGPIDEENALAPGISRKRGVF